MNNQFGDSLVDQTLDAQGLRCPLPLVKSRQALNELPVGAVLKVMATDPGSVLDFKNWAKTANHIELIAQEQKEDNGQQIFLHYLRRLR